MTQQLSDTDKIRVLTIVDENSREFRRLAADTTTRQHWNQVRVVNLSRHGFAPQTR